MAEHRLCLVARIPGVAGPAGFQRRLAEGLERRGVGVTYDLADTPYDAALVIGGRATWPDCAPHAVAELSSFSASTA